MEQKENIQKYEIKPEKKIINIMGEDKYKEMKEDKLLSLAISKLPDNYNFEIYKSLYKIKQISEKRIKSQELLFNFQMVLCASAF